MNDTPKLADQLETAKSALLNQIYLLVEDFEQETGFAVHDLQVHRESNNNYAYIKEVTCRLEA